MIPPETFTRQVERMDSSPPRLAIVTTHPVQYYAPWFKLLSDRGKVKVKVFYTWGTGGIENKFDPGFRKEIEWDLPLLEGYEHEFLENTAIKPGSHHFHGIENPDLIKNVEAFGATCILVIGWAFKSHLRCIRHFKGKVPVYFRGDSTLLDEQKGLKTVIRRLALRWVYSHIDYAFYVGTNNKAYYKKHGLKEGQLIPAPHAVDNQRFISAAQKENGREKLRKELNISADDFVVLFAGKLEQKKNPFFMLELAAEISDQGIVFLIVGNGELEKQLHKAAGKNSQVKFLPFQNQIRMPGVYAASDLFILPSTGPGETWGLAVNEAMACGLPVVVSGKVGGAVDLVKNNGIIFQHGELNKVIDYIETLKNSAAQYAKTRKASFARIKNFSFEQIVDAIEHTVLQMQTN
ncbi:glycosyltransferase family 4 protein [Flavisolibacter nicotianae]|uniref:glycosyltransferase family 4 protein n=1 Tax=Flavisolibacter nicotianae TaxID=2364882 RepID=UPI001F095954|nr:glycosyltransferase family 4 protein [Flavisolibacter nicotianae]